MELLYRHHSAWLLRQVRRRFGSDQAEDLVQETYLRAAGCHADPVLNPRALLMRIATRAAIDRDRRRRVRVPLADLGEEHAHTPADQAEAVVLKQVVHSLPEPLKEVFLLSRSEGLTYREISERCGLAVKTVEWRMGKALTHCTNALARLDDAKA